MSSNNFFASQHEAVCSIYQKLKSHKTLFLYSTLFDLLFLFITSTVNGILVRKIAGVMYVIGGLLSKASLGTTSQTSLVELFKQAGTSGYIIQLIILFLVWIGSLYFIYCFFHGLCWRLAYAMQQKPFPLLPFAKQFFKINLPIYFIFVLFNAALFVTAYISTSIANRTDASIHPVWYIPYFLLLYVALVAYGNLGKQGKQTLRAAFREAWGHKRQLIPSYVIVLLLFTVIELVMLGAGYLHKILLVVAGFFLFVPAFTVARMYWLSQFSKIFLKNKTPKQRKEG